MDRSGFEVSISLPKMNEKNYREAQLSTIITVICAFLNSQGGVLNIKYKGSSSADRSGDGILRAIEQRLVDIWGPCLLRNKIKTSQRRAFENLGLAIFVQPSQFLCTVNYNLYLPTQTQVVPVASWEEHEKVRAILTREVIKSYEFIFIPSESFVFILGAHVSFPESDLRQFNLLKAEKSKCVTLADRITNRSNKLRQYISSFGNKHGGTIFYGIDDHCIVQGEVIDEKDRVEIVRKVTKIFNKIFWFNGNLKRGKHWDITFHSVKDRNQNNIPSLLVIVIAVSPLPGGVFVQQPESYHVEEEQIKSMYPCHWKQRFFNENVPCILDTVRRIQWSSIKAHRMYYLISQKLFKCENDSDSVGFRKISQHLKHNYPAGKLIILGEKSEYAYKTGCLNKAKRLVLKFKDALWSSENVIDLTFMKLRLVYLMSEIARAQDNFQESLKIAREGLELTQIAPAGLLAACFYQQLAFVEGVLSQQCKDKSKKDDLMKSSISHYFMASQHVRASNVEQEFTDLVSDITQRICIYRAVTTLGMFSRGGDFCTNASSKIKEAMKDLTRCKNLVAENVSQTKFRKISYLLAESDLRLCQWWTQKRQQERSLVVYGTPFLLKASYEVAKEASELSRKSHFEELWDFANCRLAKITEIMIRLCYAHTAMKYFSNLED